MLRGLHLSKCFCFVVVTALPFFSEAQNLIQFSSFFSPEGKSKVEKLGELNSPRIESGSEYVLQLPTGNYSVIFKESDLIQYDQVFTGKRGNSRAVQAWEGKARENSTLFIVITIEGRIRHLIWNEEEISYKLKPLVGNQFFFLHNDFPQANKGFCGTLDSLLYRASPIGRTEAFSCQTVDIALVTDLAVNQSATQIPIIEARLLDLLASAQSYFYNFDVELKLHASSLIIPLSENPFPLPSAPLPGGFGDIRSNMWEWMEKNNFSTSKFDVSIGITQHNYQTSNNIGFTFGDRESLGIIIMELQSDESLNTGLLTHELGHVFGAGHDAAGTNFIMSPTIITSGRWSEDSRVQINNFFKTENASKFLNPCASLVLRATLLENNIILTWTASFEHDVASYVLSHNNDVLDTLSAIGNESGSAEYEFIHESPIDGRNVYKLTQLSKFIRPVNIQYSDVEINKVQNVSIALTPNPVGDWLHIAESKPGDEVIVYDYSGKVILREHLVTTSTMLSTSNLNAGLYLVRIDKDVWKLVKLK